MIGSPEQAINSRILERTVQELASIHQYPHRRAEAGEEVGITIEALPPGHVLHDLRVSQLS